MTGHSQPVAAGVTGVTVLQAVEAAVKDGGAPRDGERGARRGLAGRPALLPGPPAAAPAVPPCCCRAGLMRSLRRRPSGLAPPAYCRRTVAVPDWARRPRLAVPDKALRWLGGQGAARVLGEVLGGRLAGLPPTSPPACPSLRRLRCAASLPVPAPPHLPACACPTSPPCLCLPQSDFGEYIRAVTKNMAAALSAEWLQTSVESNDTLKQLIGPRMLWPVRPCPCSPSQPHRPARRPCLGPPRARRTPACAPDAPHVLDAIRAPA